MKRFIACFVLILCLTCTAAFSACGDYKEGAKAPFSGTIYPDCNEEIVDGQYYMKPRSIKGNGCGAAFFDAVEVEQGEPFVVYATLASAEVKEYGGVGFAVGTLGENNDKHLMFNWRPYRHDVYVSREQKVWDNSEVWGWNGFADDTFHTDLKLEGNLPIDLAFVYKDGVYYMFIGGENVVTLAENEHFTWNETKICDFIGDKGTKKFGLSMLNGKLTFSDWGYSTNPKTVDSYLEK